MIRKLKKLISFVVMKVKKKIDRLKMEWRDYSETFDRVRKEYTWKEFYSIFLGIDL